MTILKPIAGVDENLEANLVSFFELDYEPLQIIFGTDRPDDPGIIVAREVAARYPDRDVLILTDCDGPAASPKMVNLEAMLPHARHELVLLSDSNVRIGREELARLVQPMQDPRVGLVYQPVIGVDEEAAPAAVENLRLTEYPFVVTIGAKVVLGQDCVMGKGMLCRRAALAQIDDFAAVRDAAADDYLLGAAIKGAGWKLHLSEVPAWAVHVRWSWNSFVRRHTRHAAMRLRLSPLGYLLEFVCSPPVMWLVPPLLAGWEGLPWTGVSIAGKSLFEAAAMRHHRSPPMRWRHLALIPLKDLWMFYILFRALLENKVHWRGKDYRITRGTKLVRIGQREAEVEMINDK